MTRRLPPGPVSLRLWPDPAPAPPEQFDLAVTWSRDPAPQGSKGWRPIWRNAGNGPPDRKIIAMSRDRRRELAGVALTESSVHVGPWRDQVKAEAIRRRRGAPAIDFPVRAVMIFTLHRPANHYRTGRNAALLTDRAPIAHGQYPDLSKLARAVEDALVDAGVLADDSLICEYTRLAKVWAGTEPPAGWALPVYALAKPGVYVHIERGT